MLRLLSLGALVAATGGSYLQQSADRATLSAYAAASTSRQLRGETTPRRDYYVSSRGDDANDGSQHRPWATISHAGEAASAGTTIHVAPGIYRETVVTTASGTPDARITYVSDERWKASIIPSAHSIFAWKNTGSYSDVIGFDVAGTDCDGIALGASFQRAISNNAHNSAEGCNNSTGGSGIDDFNYSSRDNEIIGNYVHDVGIVDPLCGQPKRGFVHGIYQSNYGGRIDHNISLNNCGWGIHLWHAATHAVITNNTVLKNRSGGIVIGSGDAPCSTGGCPRGNDLTFVYNNIVAYNGNSVMGGWGIREEAQEPGSIGVHNQYSHNLSFQNVTDDFLLLHNLLCQNCITGRDPLFVSLSSGDFHLRKQSPAIAAGGAIDAASKDFDGKEASHRGSADIGAFAADRGERN